MSGGHFEYKDREINYIADEVQRLIETNNDESLDEYGHKKGYEFSETVIEQFKVGLLALRMAAIYAHSIDYLASSDFGEDSFMKDIKTQVDKLRKELAGGNLLPVE